MTDIRTTRVDEDKRQRLIQMIYGYHVSAMLQAVAVLGIADHLAEGDQDVVELAAATESDPTSLHRLLRGLTVIGLTEEVEHGRFQLTALGQPLRSGIDESMRQEVIMNTNEDSFRVWANLVHTVRTGGTAFQRVFGIDAFKHFARNPEINQSFNAAMAAGTRQVAPYLLAKYDFSRYAMIVDVGGGNGTLLAEILDRTPDVRGIVFDSEAGAEDAPRLLKERGHADRCQIVHGDFFESVPAGGDVYLMKSIIHDWNDELATRLLSNCRNAVRDDTKLLVLDIVLPPVIDHSDVTRTIVFSDLNMLVNTGGRERTEEEFESLLSGAGFRMTGTTPLGTPWGYCLIEAEPA